VSQQNVEIVRSLIEPFAGSDVSGIDWGSDAVREAVGHLYSDDVELRTLESGLGTGVDGFYEGLEGMIQYLQDWLEPFGEYHVEWLEYIEAGDCVLVPSRQWGVGSASGARAELELTWLYELRDGRISRMEQYDTLDEAREAAAQRQ
jgi:ketosteroid isomerase-like protein